MSKARDLSQVVNPTGAEKVGYQATGGVVRDVESKLREFVSVKDFGAVGDGVTDDTAAIQAATNTGTPVFFERGTYRANGITYTGKVVWFSDGGAKILSDSAVITVTNGSGSIIDNLELENITAPWIINRDPTNWLGTVIPVQSNGDGYQPTINDEDIWGSLTPEQRNQDIGPKIIFQGNAADIVVSRIKGRFVSILMCDTVRSEVRDCTYRAGKNFSAGILFWNINNQAGSQNKAINNKIRFASYSGIAFARNFDGVAEGNHVEYCGESGIKTWQNTVSGTDARCYRMQVLNNNTKFGYYDGFDLSSDYPHTGTIDSRHQIIGNDTFNNRQTGFYADGMNNQFIGNRARGTGKSGIKVFFNYSQIEANQVYDCNTFNASSGESQMVIDGANNGIIGNFMRQTVSNGYALYATGANYVAQNFAAAGTLFIGGGAIAIGNKDANTTPIYQSHPQQVRQNDGSVPAMTLFSESTGFDNVDQNFHPRKHVLPNPIGRIRGQLSYGSGGAENGYLIGYGAQGGALVPGWQIQTDNAIAGKAWLDIYAPNAGPYAGWMPSGTVAMWLDEAGHKLKFAVKYSNGTTLKSGEIALV